MLGHPQQSIDIPDGYGSSEEVSGRRVSGQRGVCQVKQNGPVLLVNLKSIRLSAEMHVTHHLETRGAGV